VPVANPADIWAAIESCGAEKGYRSVARALADNEKRSGITAHVMREQVDQGEIVYQRAVSIWPGDTVETLYARIIGEADFQALFEKRYAGEPFVDVLPPGSHPDTRSVRAANVCRVALHRPQGGDTLVILSVIDNLVKGAAGQAIQNMNIMFGFEETLGLEQVPVLP